MDGNPTDSTTLERLYDAHAPGLFRYLLALVRDPVEVKDWIQDVFVRLARTPGCLDGVEDVRAFIFRMGRNAVIDAARRTASRERRTEAAAQESWAIATDPDAKVFASSLDTALDRLPEAQRGVVVLKLWEGLTFEQIGNICGISANTAASRYRYAIDKLRTQLRPLYDEIREP